MEVKKTVHPTNYVSTVHTLTKCMDPLSAEPSALLDRWRALVPERMF